jgi:hypothetical protein
MSQTRTETQSPTVDAVLTYAIDTGEKIVNETMGPGDMSRKRTGKVEEKTMPMQDGRPLRDTFDLEVHGFEFVDHLTAMVDFFDEDELNSVYYKEVEELVKQRTGAVRVHVFDHTLRSGDEDFRNENLVREPVARVHNDYTEWSGPNRVQVWRAIRNPIESDPLGICDARSLADQDLVISERRYPDRIGQTYQIAHNPNHEWYYFPRMARDEALVFKVFDSATDGRARFTAHSAFSDPTSPPDAAPRESIEMRTVAFF